MKNAQIEHVRPKTNIGPRAPHWLRPKLRNHNQTDPRGDRKQSKWAPGQKVSKQYPPEPKTIKKCSKTIKKQSKIMKNNQNNARWGGPPPILNGFWLFWIVFDCFLIVLEHFLIVFGCGGVLFWDLWPGAHFDCFLSPLGSVWLWFWALGLSLAGRSWL